MKYLILLLALIATPVVAQSQTEVDLLCESLHDFTVSAHEARYNGVTLSQTLGLVNGLSEENDHIKPILREIVMTVYKQPRYSTEEYIMRDRAELALDHQLQCLDHFGDNI